LRRTLWIVALISMAAGLVFAPPGLASASVPEWGSFRGGEREGISQSTTAPVKWSATSNVRWKTAVPGEGHSSPIVSGDSVYVTTAREVQSNRWLLTLIRALIVLGMMLTALYAGRVIALGVLERRLLSSVGTAVLCSVFGGIVLFSAYLMDLGRAPERGWVAACVAAALGLVVNGLLRRESPTPKFSWSALLVILSLVGILLIPDAEHTLYGAWLGDGALLTYATTCLILLMALSLAHTFRPAIRWAAAIIAILLPPALAMFIAIKNGEMVIVSDFSPPQVPTALWVVAIALIVLWAVAAVWRVRGKSPALSAVVVVFGASAVIAGLLTLAWVAVLRAPYLAYLLGPFRPIPIGAWVMGAVCLAGGLMVFVTVVWSRGKLGLNGLNWLALAAAVTGLLFLVDARLLPKKPHLERCLVSIDRENGGIRWMSEGLPGERGDMHGDNSPATPTPATDGERIYAYFGTPGIICTDTSGKTLWINKELPFDSRNGVASSPILYLNRLIILSESDAGHWLAAFDPASGKILWRSDRGKKTHPISGNCRTPSARSIGGVPAIVVWGYEDVSAYELRSGRELWSYRVGQFGGGVDPVACIGSDSKALYLVGPQRTVALALSRLGRRASPFLWDKKTTEGAQCPSPVIANGLLFDVSDMGRIYCIDTQTGAELWNLPTMSQHYASPVVVGNLVYFTDTKGNTTILEAARKLKVVARNSLGEAAFASVAPVEESLYFRRKEHVWRVGDKE